MFAVSPLAYVFEQKAYSFTGPLVDKRNRFRKDPNKKLRIRGDEDEESEENQTKDWHVL